MKFNDESYEIIQSNTSENEKRKYWDIALGLQEVDDLKPSSYLSEIKEKNIIGEITNQEVEELLYDHYMKLEDAQEKESSYECDIVSNRIVELLEMNGFSLSPASLLSIHGYLFKDIYTHAGQFRNQNIRKEEPILNGETVKYANYYAVSSTLSFDFESEKNYRYSGKTEEEIINHISNFTSSIWQVHPFFEGNTRTTAVFIERYLNNIGFQVNNDLFKEYSKYFRNALVRDNYADYSKKIDVEHDYLRKFFRKLLFDSEILLDKNETILMKCFDTNQKSL